MSERPNPTWTVNFFGEEEVKINGTPFSDARDMCGAYCMVKTAKGGRDGVTCSGVGAFGNAKAKIFTPEGLEYFNSNAKCLGN